MSYLERMAGRVKFLAEVLRLERGLSRAAADIKAFAQRNAYIKEESCGNSDGGGAFAHVAWHLAHTAGDRALAHCVREAIQLKASVREWKLININEEVTQEEIELINRCDKLIIGGGGLFMNNSPNVSGWHWPIPPDDLKKIAPPVCVYSVGYNYYRGVKPNALFIESLNALAEKAAFFGLRNMGSVNAVRQLVLPQLREKIVHQPCTTTIARLLFGDALPKKAETGNIAVNVPGDMEESRYGKNGGEDALNEVAAAIKAIEERGYKIHYAIHMRSDEKFLPYLKRHKVRYRLTDLSMQYPRAIFGFYNKMDLVIGMRGHALMVPFGVNCEIISLSTHDKTKWFMEDINAPEWNIEVMEHQGNLRDVIIDKFVSVHETNQDETKRRLLAEQQRLFEVTQRNLAIINGL